MYGLETGQLYIDEIPLGDMKQLEEISGDIENDFDMPNMKTLGEGLSGSFEVKMKESAIKKLFRPCFGIEPYRNLEKCSKCFMKKDCVVAKIENNFNRRRQYGKVTP